MLVSDLYKKTLYIADIDFLINNTIYEYDLAKANISILRQANVITESFYQEMLNADRMTRQVTIGKLYRNNETIRTTLDNGFIEARRLLFDSNNIEDKDVLSIKKDAVFVLKRLSNTKFYEYLDFKEKNLYTSYYKISSQKKELYYSKHPVTGEEKLDVKGINDESLIYHKDYMIEFLLVLFETVQIDIVDAIGMMNRFMEMYKAKQLQPGFYRNFNTESKYTIGNGYYLADNVSTDMLPIINISYNDILLRDLYKILAKQYFLTYKKPRC